MVVLQVVVAFIPGEPIELAAGYAFGFWEGSILTMAGFLLGSWLVFALVRKFGVKLVEVFFHKNKVAEFRFLQNPKKVKVITFLLMLIPGTPKDLLTYFVGLTRIKLHEFLILSLIARIPSLVSSTVGGNLIQQESYYGAVWVFLITGAVSLLGIFLYNRIVSFRNRKRNADE